MRSSRGAAKSQDPRESLTPPAESTTSRRSARRRRFNVGLRVTAGVVGFGLAAVLLVACGHQETRAGDISSQITKAGADNTITVSGRGTVDASPDEAVVTITVETQGADPASALDANSKTTKNVSDRLSAEGIQSDAIQTSNVSVYPDRTYDPKTGKESITGYHATNSVVVTLKDAATVGKVLSGTVEAGATNVSGPVWRVAADSPSVTEALKKAVANARTKAQALAEAEGIKLGAVLTMTEGSVDQPISPQFDSARAAGTGSVATPPVSAGTIEITANMTITYSLTR